MPSWILKAAIQNTLCLLPQPQRWNQWFQHRFTGSLALTKDYFVDKWRQCERHLGIMQDQNIKEPLVMELGTGWFQISPIGFALRGVKTVYTVDRQSLIDHDRLRGTLEMYRTMIDAGNVTGVVDGGYQRLCDVIAAMPGLSAADALARFNIFPLVTDARQIALPNASIDMFMSNNTLEHISAPILAGIFKEFARLGKPHAIMSHYIDLSDHYSHFDKSLSAVHFLRFSESQWRWFNNDLHYQNRLRVYDYRDIHRTTGWRIIDEKNDSDGAESINRIRIANMYKRQDPAELAIFRSWMISQR